MRTIVLPTNKKKIEETTCTRYELSANIYPVDNLTLENIEAAGFKKPLKTHGLR